jgi:hypothetical protein
MEAHIAIPLEYCLDVFVLHFQGIRVIDNVIHIHRAIKV